jgi:hypothetical protein
VAAVFGRWHVVDVVVHAREYNVMPYSLPDMVRLLLINIGDVLPFRRQSNRS